MSKKYTIESVKQYFQDNGCTLLEEEYINNHTKMRYICNCGNQSEIRWNDFNKGKRCKKCSGTEKHTYEYVYNYFKDEGWILIDKDYINASKKIKAFCNNNHIVYISWGNFRSGWRCSQCSGKKKYTYEYVYNYFKDNGCELLEDEYISSQTKMKYICKCGNISKMCFSIFKTGVRCKECGYKKITGDNSYKWKKNREEIKLNLRLRQKRNKKWIVNNMQHDINYINFLNNPKKYHVDHIIPVSIFTKIVTEYNLDEQVIKTIINKPENLQLLTKEENMSKSNKGCLFKACQYLSLNGIKLIKEKNHVNSMDQRPVWL